MKDILLLTVALVGLCFSGFYFVVRPTQMSNTRKYCNAQATKTATTTGKVDSVSDTMYTNYNKATYEDQYTSCLRQHGI